MAKERDFKVQQAVAAYPTDCFICHGSVPAHKQHLTLEYFDYSVPLTRSVLVLRRICGATCISRFIQQYPYGVLKDYLVVDPGMCGAATCQVLLPQSAPCWAILDRQSGTVEDFACSDACAHTTANDLNGVGDVRTVGEGSSHLPTIQTPVARALWPHEGFRRVVDTPEIVNTTPGVATCYGGRDG